MWQDSLEYIMHEVCPHCGNYSEEVVKYVQEHDNDPIALYLEAIKLCDSYQGDLIGILQCSDYNIFVPWFKAFLIYVKDHAKTGSSFMANDLLEYYHKAFDKVEINKAELEYDS